MKKLKFIIKTVRKLISSDTACIFLIKKLSNNKSLIENYAFNMPAEGQRRLHKAIIDEIKKDGKEMVVTTDDLSTATKENMDLSEYY